MVSSAAFRGRSMTAAIPSTRPRLSRQELANLLARKLPGASLAIIGDETKTPLLIVGVRGYYLDSMGKPGVNDRGIYDDAIFVVTPSTFTAFNANVDPSGYRKGAGKAAGKGMASLKPGVWPAYRFGKHKGQYEALIQTGGTVTVSRDGFDGPYDDTGWFGINIHKGGINTTSSEGCQTIPPAQWPAFIALVHDQAARLFGAAWRDKTVPYVLLDGAK